MAARKKAKVFSEKKNETQDTDKVNGKEADKVSDFSLSMCDDDVMNTNNVIPMMDDQAGEVCDSETTDFEEIEHNCDLCDFL